MRKVIEDLPGTSAHPVAVCIQLLLKEEEKDQINTRRALDFSMRKVIKDLPATTAHPVVVCIQLLLKEEEKDTCNEKHQDSNLY